MLTRNWITGPQKHIPRVILFLRGDPIKSSRAFSSGGRKSPYKRRANREKIGNLFCAKLRISNNFKTIFLERLQKKML